MGNVKLGQLQMLVMVVDTGSFSAASAEMNCTQSSVSHSISELERNLGARLLVRSSKGCTPTEFGQRVLTKARQMLKVAGSISLEAQHSGIRTGHVRIASIPPVTARLVPYAVEIAAEEHPQIRIEIFDGCREYDDVSRMVQAGEADIGITQAADRNELNVTPYVYDDYVAVLPGSAAVYPPLRWCDLADLPLILQKHQGSAWVLEELCKRGLQRVPAYAMEHESSILTMIERGLGYTVVPRLTVAADWPGLKVLDLPCTIQRRLSIVTRAAPRNSDAVNAVARLIGERRVIMRSSAYRSGAVGIGAPSA